jgi:Cdc6-like AAA superfamily ATPase
MNAQVQQPILPVDKLPPLFQLMLKYPNTISHMLFVGPPGSGKTTTALSFASALHGGTMNRFASVLFLNSSDERSLDTMRQKVYPFVESRMQSLFFTGSNVFPPKVIVFDEAETLTEQAQCALRPLLQRSTQDVILIFICNSLSHINPNIISKFLCVPFPPIDRARVGKILEHSAPPQLDLLLRRGDLRYFKLDVKSNAITEFLFKILHAQTLDDILPLFLEPGAPFRERISWLLLFLHSINKLNIQDIPIWSALSASEVQPYLSKSQFQDLVLKVWISTFQNLLNVPT